MVRFLIGMGSNIEPEHHLCAAAQAIRQQFGQVDFSSVYRSKAVGMDGDDFLNACCIFSADLTHENLLYWLKALEDEHGRDRSEGSWKPRTLDLDILLIDDAVVDEDLYRYGHIFVPASELIRLKRPQNVQFTELVQINVNL